MVIKEEKSKSLVGSIFGRLTVISMVNGSTCYCQCECGNTKEIAKQSILRGATKSCGCLERESRFGRKHGKYHVGDQINEFILIRETDKRCKNKSIIWECQCKCGNIIEASPSKLIKDKKMNCGCDYIHPLRKDLTGQRFGMLVAIRESKDKKYKTRRVAWICKCDCGNEVTVPSISLTDGRAKSCGCRNKSIKVDYISSCLASIGLNFCTEYRFADCKDIKALPFDFYIPSIKTAIEYDGRQHYEPVELWGGVEGYNNRKMHDDMKNKYCQQNGINLIRLPYFLSDEEIRNEINKLEPVTSKCYAEQSA